MLRHLLTLTLCVAAAHAASNRLYLASQYEWGAKQGFYVDFECDAAGDAPCKLADLRLILGLADGQEWRFVSTRPTWQLEHDYLAKAVFDAQGGELWLDGQSVGKLQPGYMPYAGSVMAADQPPWASATADYLIRQTSLKVSAGGQTLEQALPGSHLHPALELFATAPALSFPFKAPDEAAVTVEVGFRLAARPDAKALAPLLDRFGQNRYADWPGKVRSEAQLKAEAAAEPAKLAALGLPQGFDAYGGRLDAPWKLPRSGYYAVTRRDGRWWMVSPEGNPLFYLGLCGVPMLTWETTPVTGREWLYEWLPEKTGEFAGAWSKDQWGTTDGTEYVCFHAVNLMRAYGADWQAESARRAVQRVKTWGFSGAAKWGHQDGLADTPVLTVYDVPSLVRRVDFFDADLAQRFAAGLRSLIEPRLTDPTVVGWTVGSEYDQIVTGDEIKAILAKREPCASRAALLAWGTQQLYAGDRAKLDAAWKAPALDPPATDLEALRRYYEDAWYAFCMRTVKAIDPHHLYLGNYIVPGWWVNEEDWRIAARHCDAVSYDRYDLVFADERFARLIRETDKPIFCGEFAYPPFYGGARGFGRYPVWADDEKHAGELYAKWVEAALANPWCVGVCWFMYRDQPLTGRGPGRGQEVVYNEHYAFGFVDGCDRPKWDLIGKVREVNLAAARRRMALPPP